MTNPSTAAARVVVDELVAQGVVEVVLAPGSRSAALALALADADRHGRLRLHVRVDERTAAFLALGLAKAGGSPAAVVTTSGSAAANLAPAATEAAYSGVPLLLLTADRPPELRGTGANQSVDHRAILGGIVVASLDLGVPERRVGAVAAWRSTLARAVALADDPHRPGPVHLDLPFRDPLVPGEDDEPWPEPLEGRRDADGDPRPFTLDRRRAAEAQAETLSDVLAAVDRHAVPAHGLVVVGDGVDEDAADAALALAAGCGWPVISEPSGNARRGPQALAHASLTAPGVTAALGAPEVVVAVGRVGLSRSITALLRTAATLVVVAVPGRDVWSDPVRGADVVVAAVPTVPDEGHPRTRLSAPAFPTDSAAPLREPARADEGEGPWLAAWRAADHVREARLVALLDEQPALTGLDVARTLWDVVEDEALLLVAASRPVRDLEATARVREDGAPWVIGNRGTSGIDGLVSTAWGAALAHGRRSGAPSYALLGDLATVHDLTGFAVGDDEPRPDLVYVICDNDGGGIFTSLEQGEPRHGEHFERVFGTPLGLDLVAVLTALGVPAVRVGSRDGLVEALDHATAAGGVRVVVAATGDRRSEAALQGALRA